MTSFSMYCTSQRSADPIDWCCLVALAYVSLHLSLSLAFWPSCPPSYDAHTCTAPRTRCASQTLVHLPGPLPRRAPWRAATHAGKACHIQSRLTPYQGLAVTAASERACAAAWQTTDTMSWVLPQRAWRNAVCHARRTHIQPPLCGRQRRGGHYAAATCVWKVMVFSARTLSSPRHSLVRTLAPGVCSLPLWTCLRLPTSWRSETSVMNTSTSACCYSSYSGNLVCPTTSVGG